jgi:hypothetical protein
MTRFRGCSSNRIDQRLVPLRKQAGRECGQSRDAGVDVFDQEIAALTGLKIAGV